MTQSQKQVSDDIVPTDPEDKLVQESIKKISTMWKQHNVAEENASRIKIEIGEYIFEAFFKNDENKLYDDENKYNPRKVNSYNVMLASDKFKTEKISAMTLRNMLYCGVAARYLESQNIQIKNMIADDKNPLTFTHLKFLARLERDHENQKNLIQVVIDKKLSSRDLEKEVQKLSPKQEEEEPGEYDKIMPKVNG